MIGVEPSVFNVLVLCMGSLSKILRPLCALSMALMGASPAYSQSMLVVTPGHIILPPPAGTPMTAYEVSFPKSTSWESDSQVARALIDFARPEPLTVNLVDAKNRKISVVTTARGRSNIDTVAMPVTIAPLEPIKPEMECSSVFAETARGGEIIRRSGDVCPFGAEINPERHLIVEGLDRTEARLFAALSDDPRWSINESFGPDGKIALLSQGRSAGLPDYVNFRAVVDERLSKLRVWQVDAKGDVKKLTDIPWQNVKTPSSR